MDSRTQLSASILVGACIVGLGLYCGLRERAAGPKQVPRAAGETELSRARGAAEAKGAASAPASAPRGAMPNPRPDASSLDVPRPQSTAEATESPEVTQAAAVLTPSHRAVVSAFDEIRQDVLDDCWSPGADDPASAQLTLSLSFDAAGKLVGQGVHQPAAGHVGLGRCVARKLAALRIEGTGARVRVDVPVQLP